MNGSFEFLSASSFSTYDLSTKYCSVETRPACKFCLSNQIKRQNQRGHQFFDQKRTFFSKQFIVSFDNRSNMDDLKQLKQLLQQKMGEEPKEARDDCTGGDAMWETQAWLLRARLQCTAEMNGYVESFKTELENANKLTESEVVEKATLALHTSVASCTDQFLGKVYKKEVVVPKCDEANVEGVEQQSRD